MDSEQLIAAIRDQLIALEIDGLDATDIHPETRLIEDLGMDSLLFIDLTVALEEVLELDEFPMQEWVDQQREEHAPMTIGALAASCIKYKHAQEAGEAAS